MKKNRPVRTVLSAVLLLWQAGFLFAAGGDDTAVMLQGFHWDSWRSAPWWGELGRRAGELSSSGINLVWLPPSSDSLAPEGYLPRKLQVQDSAYGSAAQLAAAVKALRGAGLRVIADVVVNHRVGTGGWADFTLPAWGDDAVCSDDEWGRGKGAPDTGKGFHAARDIDHTKTYVRESVKAWLNGLRVSPGYDGWRYDYARGLAPRYLLEYNRATAPSFAVAEIWDDLDLNYTDAHRQALADWMDAVNGEIKVFDFTTKGVLQQALLSGEMWRLADKNNRPSGLLGWWPANAVTFLDNHDTGPSPGGKLKDKAWPFPSDKVPAGYAYLLTHPGIPCVYWPHFFDWGLKDRITALIRLRRAAGLTSSSKVTIVKAEQGLYAALVDGKVALRLGDRPWAPGAGWKLSADGPGYAVWTR
ncbi:MAG: alpha-amylase family glycosyl hydrolase [Elusimicrobiales bacterium]|nr:alpha-amylase family glycosyl hydrolase [Elusimicrobiales bacterium]